jgi:Protein of unknown function (DUF3800)
MYSLGCVLIDDSDWQHAFEEVLDLRRRLFQSYSLYVRTEVKAQWLVRGNGPLTPLRLSPRVRFLIYRAHMDILAQLPARAFAIAVDKRQGRHGSAVFDLAWEGLLQRLERTSTKEGKTVMVIHDEGEDPQVKRWVRRARRYLTAGSYGPMRPGSMGNNPMRLLVEDPVPRDSAESYFVQLADLVAYAAFRSVIPPSSQIGIICPGSMWQRIGPATHTAVARLAPRAASGIVLR